MKNVMFILIAIISSYNVYSKTVEEYNDRGVDKHDLKDYRGAIEL